MIITTPLDVYVQLKNKIIHKQCDCECECYTGEQQAPNMTFVVVILSILAAVWVGIFGYVVYKREQVPTGVFLLALAGMFFIISNPIVSFIMVLAVASSCSKA